MREIKFRAWDKHLKKMFLPDTLARLHFNKGLPYCFYTIKGQMIIHKALVLMQYTGLKDRNGKEIYERDIVQLESIDDPPDVFVVAWEESGYFTLKPFIDPEGYIPTLGYFTDNNLNDNYYSIEVIGNRCENPELVGDK